MIALLLIIISLAYSEDILRVVDAIYGHDEDECLTGGADFPCKTIAYAIGDGIEVDVKVKEHFHP